jgi:hypothetical protein
MTFNIPETLNTFSVNGIQGLIEQAQAEYAALRDSVTADTVTDDELAALKALQQFAMVDGPAEITGRTTRAAEFAALDAPATPEVPVEPEPVVASATTEPTTVVEVKVSDIVANAVPGTTTPPVTARPTYSALVASAGLPGYEASAPLNSMLDVAKAFEAASQGHGGMASRGVPGEHATQVAVLRRNYPAEFSMNMDSTDYPKLLHVIDESRLPGGSLLASAELRYQELLASKPDKALVAAAGWCAPSETDYSICLQISTDGLWDAPEVQARRGGVRHNSGIEFDSIFGSGTGFFNLTEAQVASGTTKTCLEIPCPDFVDTRLGVTGLCLTGNILSIRGYPEFTETFTRGAMAASAHQVNREQIAAVVTGSTSVVLTAAAPWATDGSTVSQVLSAVEMAIVDIKYRMRMMRDATLEVVLPFWVLAQMRADYSRRTNPEESGGGRLSLSDDEIRAAFATRGARVQFVYDWQDAFATGAATGSPGADTPINNLPTSLQFLVYPTGTWVRAVSDVITLNSVYDSTKLATNQVTHLFTESGWAVLKMCPISRVYTVPVCPSGKTTSTGTLTCPS